ncbi:MAG TPA: hypothetical protein DHV68_00830 [Dehalococcoidia bacterium]|nr:hypothetical protein [Dehalococcoidia bacterium]
MMLGYQAKKESILDLLENNPDVHENIRRMRQGELRNEEARYEQQLEKLEESRSVAVALKPVASGLARVV